MRLLDVLRSTTADPRRSTALTSVAFVTLFVGVGAVVVAGTSTESQADAITRPAATTASIDLDQPTGSALSVGVSTMPPHPFSTQPPPADHDESPTTVPVGDAAPESGQEAPGVVDAEPGCTADCITDAWVTSSGLGTADVELHVQTDTPAQLLVFMMALGQGDGPAAGDPYATSALPVTDWNIDLDDLLPATTYEVAIVAIDADGESQTLGLSFTTSSPPPDQLSMSPAD